MPLVLYPKRLVQFDTFRKIYYDLYECSKCLTVFPIIQGVICCNGKAIVDCPYCHPEKQMDGR